MFKHLRRIFLIFLSMKFFDFHHHHLENEFGIYNLKYNEDVPKGFFSAGIHPDAISTDIDTQFEWLKEISKLPNCVAIGECGLDGLIDVEDKLQEDVFKKQIFWANEVRKPIIIHCVKRFSRLGAFKKLSKVPLIVHGFNKRKSIGDELKKNNFYLSFGQSVLYNVNLQEFLRDFPLDKMFLETDSADFDIEELYAKVASLKKMNSDELTQKIKENLQVLQISI